VEFVTADATADRGNTVTLTIKAKIKASVTDADLIAKYGSKDIPNKADVVIDGEGRPTNEVIVTPPDEEDKKPEKKVNGKERLDLADGQRNKEFTYTVSKVIPKGAKTVTFTDTLEWVLQVNEATIDVDGVTPSVNGNTVTAVIPNATEAELGGKTVTLTIKANIRNNVTDEDLIKDYGTAMEIPNKATVDVDGKGQVTNDVIVTPPSTPPTTPPITKTVNGKAHHNLESTNEVFHYAIETSVPKNADTFVITDTLEPVLDFASDVTVLVGGEAGKADVAVNGKTLTVTVADVPNNGEKPVVITFDAVISPAATSDQLEAYANRMIPNQASYDINNNPAYHKDSNPVTVTPPTPTNPELAKEVKRYVEGDA
jgi:fimbrial isopeptide formation D2 family protein